MPKRSYDWDKLPQSDKLQVASNKTSRRVWHHVSRVACHLLPSCVFLVIGCATPEYAIRPTPTPEETVSALQIERGISQIQAKEFERQGARSIDASERLAGFEIQRLVDQLSRVTERPSLRYRAYLYRDDDPNAAALADGRIYISTGLLNYLASRSSHEAEFAFIIGHELAHTVAQHLVKRYRTLQQQQLLMTIVAAGAAAAAGNAGAGAQQAGRLLVNAASLIQDVHNSGYSQEQELEADQLGIRYVIKAGFDPNAALALLEDFERFDNPWPFLRTHPYIAIRREYLHRYLAQAGYLGHRAAVPPQSSRPSRAVESRLEQLRQIQQSYPVGSVSWRNLQRQIEESEGPDGR